MKLLLRLCLLSAALLAAPRASAQPVKHEETLLLMGSRFEVVAIAPDDSLARAGVAAGIAEIRRIERLISSWDPASQTSEINRQAGRQAVRVDRELYDLIYRANKVSELTDGAFDLSFAAIDPVWRFDGSMTAVPSGSAIEASIARIGYRKIRLGAADTSVFLTEAGMKIGFGAIGKGYAANRARAVMRALGIGSGLVNAGGDLTCWGSDLGGQPWRIGIADPDRRDVAAAWLVLSDQAVVTSGDYERYARIGGQRYGHIIDPRSGWPARGLRSATVVCADAELADALATAAFVLGPTAGLDLLERLRGVEGLLITDTGQWLTTSGMKIERY
ncbi:MAG: FAD:protein FMN transferase [Bacteroidia bacterium]